MARTSMRNCGALHPEIVAKAVTESGADLGICFDGDADRALFADHTGKVVNGDAVLYLAAREMRERGALKMDTVVATTMSNMGLEAALKHEGIKMLRAPVGDKYVLEEMRKSGATLGGEQSGHVIFSDLATTGDGLLTTLEVLKVVCSQWKIFGSADSRFEGLPAGHQERESPREENRLIRCRKSWLPSRLRKGFGWNGALWSSVTRERNHFVE